MEGQTDGQMEGQTDGQMEGQTDGRTDGQMPIINTLAKYSHAIWPTLKREHSNQQTEGKYSY